MRTLTILLAGLLAAPPAWANAPKDDFSQEEREAARQDPYGFQIDPGSIRVKRLETVRSDILDPSLARGSDKDLISDIINIGEKLWKIIERNKPVVDIKTTSANAFPKGISHWTELSGWRPPEATLYEYSAKNMWGKQVVRVRFQVHRMHGGHLQGRGKFLNHVTVEPLEVQAAYGYKLYLDADIPSVANVGTAEEPLAAMIVSLKWRVQTSFKVHEGTTVYYLQGDGSYRDVGGPFDDDMFRARERAAKAAEALAAGVAWN